MGQSIPQIENHRIWCSGGVLQSDPDKHPELVAAVTGTGTVTAVAGGGWKLLGTAANDYAVVHGYLDTFKINSSLDGSGTTAQPYRLSRHQDYAEIQEGVRFKFSDGYAVGAYMGVFIGIADKTTTMIADTTGALVSSFDGAGFVYEANTAGVLKICYSNAATQTKTAITEANGFTAEAVAAAARAMASTRTTMFRVTIAVEKQGYWTINWWIGNTHIWRVEVTSTGLDAAMRSIVGIKSLSSPDEILYLDWEKRVGEFGDAALVTA